MGWVVVLEGTTNFERSTLRRLLEFLADLSPVALHSPARYAVQMEVAAGDHTEAVRLASDRWRSALEHGGLAGADVVRAEVFTTEELERDFRDAGSFAPAQAPGRHLRVVGPDG